MRLVPNICENDLWEGKSTFIPSREEIPKEFWGVGQENKWKNIYVRWYYKGLPDNTEFMAKPGIDNTNARNAVRALMVCRKPEANHKSAACSFLLSEWFEDVRIP